MCGRYTLRSPDPVDYCRTGPNRQPRFNIAPSQTAPIICVQEGTPIEVDATWGFRPGWLKDPRKAQINARSETAAEKPMFRHAYKKGRCLVPADGWYEWQAGEGGKTPYFIHRPDDRVFWFAGLCTQVPGEPPTYAILTTSPSNDLRHVHRRMPAVLPRDSHTDWLDLTTDAHTLRLLLAPAPEGDFAAYPVSRRVNNPRNETPDCVTPA